MVIKTEGLHRVEFVVEELFDDGYEARGVGTLKSGNAVVSGQMLALDGNGKLIPATGAHDSAGDSTETLQGFAIDNYDATDGDVPNVVFIGSLAAVSASTVTLNTASGGAKAAADAAVKKFLASKFVFLR